MPRLSLEYKGNEIKAKANPLLPSDLIRILQTRKTRKAESLAQRQESSPAGLIEEVRSTGHNGEELIPAPKTYSLLLKIAELSQYYLSSSSLQLRIMILSLLKTAIPSLSLHEDSFLPAHQQNLASSLPEIARSRINGCGAHVGRDGAALSVRRKFYDEQNKRCVSEFCAIHARYRPVVPRALPKLTTDQLKDGPVALMLNEQTLGSTCVSTELHSDADHNVLSSCDG